MLGIEQSITIVQQNNFQRPNQSTLSCLVTVFVHNILWIDILVVQMYPDLRIYTYIFLINKSSCVEFNIVLRWQNVLLKRLIDWKHRCSFVTGLLLSGILGYWKSTRFQLKESIRSVSLVSVLSLTKEGGAISVWKVFFVSSLRIQRPW